jgi:hypothetical protein
MICVEAMQLTDLFVLAELFSGNLHSHGFIIVLVGVYCFDLGV